MQEPAASSPGKTRVVRLFSRLNIGGPSVHVILLTAGLREKGYDTRLIVGRDDRDLVAIGIGAEERMGRLHEQRQRQRQDERKRAGDDLHGAPDVCNRARQTPD